MMSYDELGLEKLGDEKTALFAVVSDTDPTFNFISAMMYSQMFNVLCDRALKRKPDFSPLWMEFICRGAASRRIRLSWKSCFNPRSS